MDPGTIVALVGIGVLFILVLFMWFMVEMAHKKAKNEFKFAIGSAFAFQHQINDVFVNYASYIRDRNDETKNKVISSIDTWMLTMDQLIEPAEVARLRKYMYEKLDITSLDQTIAINQEIIADLGYAKSGSKQAILIALNNLDNYLYNITEEQKNKAKEMLYTQQAGSTFAVSLAYVAI